jgi:geranylgeranylglycerol-phosphate geranylgeranyltransferase
MRRVAALIQITRPVNMLLSACAVVLGYHVAATPPNWVSLSLLCAAALCTTAFGNVINDVLDIPTDRISHPDRPLVTGAISRHGALLYAWLLGLSAALLGFAHSPQSALAVLVPLAALLLYSLLLKQTPLSGNVTVSLLVAYALVFGGLHGPQRAQLYIPALLAFLLNLCREIFKDIQDCDGDTAAGKATSAVLPAGVLQAVCTTATVGYLLLLELPVLLGQRGVFYLGITLGVCLPLSLYRLYALFFKQWQLSTAQLSRHCKIEMLCGLCALGVDYWVSVPMGR